MTTDAQPRTRAEPVNLMHAAASSLTVDEAATGYARIWQADPEEWFQPGVCRHCQTPLGSTQDDLVMSLGSFGWLPNVCCPNCAETGKARLADEDQKARANALSGVIPAEFAYWNQSLGNNEAKAKALGAFKPELRRGMILHGTTGGCKTRIMWELVKLVVALPDAQSWYWLDAFDAATKGIPVEAERAQFLFIDDLGNEPTSTKYETAMLRLIRKRNDWHRPIFITTQLTGIVFKRRFFEGAAAEAILRRLTERTDRISTDNIT
jgi:hypothetical protein